MKRPTSTVGLVFIQPCIALHVDASRCWARLVRNGCVYSPRLRVVAREQPYGDLTVEDIDRIDAQHVGAASGCGLAVNVG